MQSQDLLDNLKNRFADQVADASLDYVDHLYPEVTLTVSVENLIDVMHILRNDTAYSFEQLMDLCGVDYMQYGLAEWKTEAATSTGYSRGVNRDDASYEQLATELSETSSTDADATSNVMNQSSMPERYAVAYHLLSTSHNHRLRVKVPVSEALMVAPTVTSIWNAADWYEREAFDLYGIIFEGHHDMRRLLTDYGFVGHPFRKDFPLIGEVEMRYDATEGRCVYEPVSITPRTLVPRVIRQSEDKTNESASDTNN